jgi:hypothetical protein
MLSAQTVLYKVGAPLTHVYLPRATIVSWINATDGRRVEGATIGREGMVGLLALWGTTVTFAEAIVQVSGEAMRIPSDRLRTEAVPGTPLHEVLCAYMKAFMHQVGQSVACNALHSVRQRCCRWLLSAQDRLLADRLPLTQDMLARTLGVRRASVANVVCDLQAHGFIVCQRGEIMLVNRSGVEAAACSCYGVVKQVFDRLYGPDAPDGR